MQGVDTVLFSLCHGNNTKPNCPPFCLSTCIYFVFLFSFLSPACTVRFLGVCLSPSLHHSLLLEPIILSGQPFQFLQRKGPKEISIYSLCRQHHTFTNLFLRSHSRDFHSSLCSFFPSQSFPSVVSHSFHEASPDSVNKGLVVCDTNILLCDTLSGVVCHCSRMLASEPNRIVWAFTSPLAICCALA